MARHSGKGYAPSIAHGSSFAFNPDPSMKSSPVLCALACVLLPGLTSCWSDGHAWSKQAETMGTTITPVDEAHRTFDSRPTPGRKALETLPSTEEPVETAPPKTVP